MSFSGHAAASVFLDGGSGVSWINALERLDDWCAQRHSTAIFWSASCAKHSEFFIEKSLQQSTSETFSAFEILTLLPVSLCSTLLWQLRVIYQGIEELRGEAKGAWSLPPGSRPGFPRVLKNFGVIPWCFLSGLAVAIRSFYWLWCQILFIPDVSSSSISNLASVLQGGSFQQVNWENKPKRISSKVRVNPLLCQYQWWNDLHVCCSFRSMGEKYRREFLVHGGGRPPGELVEGSCSRVSGAKSWNFQALPDVLNRIVLVDPDWIHCLFSGLLGEKPTTNMLVNSLVEDLELWDQVSPVTRNEICPLSQFGWRGVKFRWMEPQNKQFCKPQLFLWPLMPNVLANGTKTDVDFSEI